MTGALLIFYYDWTIVPVCLKGKALDYQGALFTL